MSTNNALCFISVGLVMFGLPSLAPNSFPPHEIFGTSTSALWLAFMGTVLALLGATFLVANEVWPLAKPALEWPPLPVEADMPAAVVVRPSIMLAVETDETGSREAAA